MDQLQLSKELFFEIVDWMGVKGYRYKTIKEYSRNLRWLFKKYGVLNAEVLKKAMKHFKHPNQRAIFNIINKYCYENNIKFNLIIPAVKQPPRKLPEILSQEEVRLFVNAPPYPWSLMMRCIYGIGGGLRVGEIIKLCWDHVRWVDWLKGQSYGECVIKDSKRGEERVLNIPGKIMKDLYELAKSKGVLNEFRIPSGNMIFPIKFGKYKTDLMINNQKLWREKYLDQAERWIDYNIVRKYCRKAINKEAHIHQLRHTRATYLLEVEKVPIERISQLLGHKDIKTTMIYTRVDPRTTFKMMENTKVI